MRYLKENRNPWSRLSAQNWQGWDDDDYGDDDDDDCDDCEDDESSDDGEVDVDETSQELRMLSSVTINCQITKIGMNSGSQLSEL